MQGRRRQFGYKNKGLECEFTENTQGNVGSPVYKQGKLCIHLLTKPLHWSGVRDESQVSLNRVPNRTAFHYLC